MDSLLERFCRYVCIDTQADEKAAGYPSSAGQLELGRQLVCELRESGLPDASADCHGIVTATLQATSQRQVPVIAWLAHLDTSPETSGRNVRPVVHRGYDGRDIVLPGDPTKILLPADDADLARMTGATLITSDGTTLLGADDKAGVAVIMEAVTYLARHPEVAHGPVRACFTCDEEIGRGVDHLDPGRLGARVAYTLDGAGQGAIDVETFSADLAVVTVRGVNTHPSVAKGRMVNAVRLAGLLLDRLPRAAHTPETTCGREGFLHPYRVDGGVAETTVRILLRDFDADRLGARADLVRSVGRLLQEEYPGAVVDVQVTPQYRNMAEGLAREPRAVGFAEEAMRRAGLQPRRTIVRGGTDGSRLTEMGLPTPNLSAGEHNLHSPLEWTSLEEMAAAVRVLVELARVWGEQG